MTTGPANGSTSVNTTTGAVTYTPAKPGYTGPDEFFYTVQDNEGAVSHPAKVTVTITEQSAAQRRRRYRFDDVQHGGYLNVLGNDSDPNGTLAPATVTVTCPAHGSTSVNTTTGAVTYTPATNYTGTDEFFYTVQDNEGAVSSPAKVTADITAIRHLRCRRYRFHDVQHRGDRQRARQRFRSERFPGARP